MESDHKAVPQDPTSQATNLIPEAQAIDPGSVATTEQGVNDSSLTPELESYHQDPNLRISFTKRRKNQV